MILMSIIEEYVVPVPKMISQSDSPGKMASAAVERIEPQLDIY